MPEQSILELEKQLVSANEAVTNLTAANALLTTQLADAEIRNKKLRRSSRSGESALRAELTIAQSRRL